MARHGKAGPAAARAQYVHYIPSTVKRGQGDKSQNGKKDQGARADESLDGNGDR